MPSILIVPLLKVPPSLIQKINVLAWGSTVLRGLSNRPWTAAWNGAHVVGSRLVVQAAEPGRVGLSAKSVGTNIANGPISGSLSEFVLGVPKPWSTLLILIT